MSKKMTKQQKIGNWSLVAIVVLLIYSHFSRPPENKISFEIPSATESISSEKFLGKNVFLFFGFTKCPHICPTTMVQLGNFLKNRDDSVAVFVSVDFKHDTLDVLSEYSKRIPKNFYAGTYPDEAKLKALMKQFNASYSLTYDEKNPDNPPLIDHSSLIYVLNKKGQWVDQLPYNTTSEELAKLAVNIDSKSRIADPVPSTQANLIQGENTDCNLALNTCSLPGMEVYFEQKPVVILKDFNFILNVTDPAIGIPLKVEFNGKEINMGFLSSEFKIKTATSYQAKIHLPFCETPTMNWALKVLVQPHEDQGDELHEYVFHFTTLQSK
jgi:protein SCO1